MRRADSVSATGKDFDRALCVQGVEQAKNIGQYFYSNRFPLDHIICSPALRTRQTFQYFTHSWTEIPDIEFIQSLYENYYAAHISALEMIDRKFDNILLIGHNPIIMQLAVTLSKPALSNASRKFTSGYPVGSLAVIRFADKNWPDSIKTRGTLDRFISPQDLVSE
jgi:phosphohistidine phosphatase